ncbi:MAG: type I glyceraldehyde-3-phosphate dehydrogenase [Acidimicrobiaceae bacterium]|nr:type I glyceraldehyde-3-phosphate dehydrogenase [Acidimicrobiaceae bacterium]
MTIRVAVNGFGRIGRNFARALHGNDQIELVAANDLADVNTLAHLLKYDTVHGRATFEIKHDDTGISVDGRYMDMYNERDPKNLPWADLGVDVVIESTGFFTTRYGAAKHLSAGASRVIISAPSGDCDATYVVGVNDQDFDAVNDIVISNASCTTNCLAPMVKVLDDTFGLEKGFITTIHAYTGDQSIVDSAHRDLRRARAAAANVVPTSTGAARAIGIVMPHLAGKLDGMAVRVPIPNGSITDFVGTIGAEVTVDDVNDAFRSASTSGPLARVLDYSDEPLVSSDIVGTAASCTFDSGLTMAMGNTVKVAGWYDNEWGYSNRLVDLAELVGAATS